MDDNNKIIKSVENLGVLIDGGSEAVKHEIKKRKGRFLGILLEILCPSMVGNMVTGKGVLTAKKRCCKGRKGI